MTQDPRNQDAAPPRPVDAERVDLHEACVQVAETYEAKTDAIHKFHVAYDADVDVVGASRDSHEAQVKHGEAIQHLVRIARKVGASPAHSPDKAAEREGVAWRPMKDAPADGKTQIVARHQSNDQTPHGWIATITIDPDDEDRRSGLDTIIHYNGERLLSGFHGMWTGWMYPEEFAALAPQPTGTEASRGVCAVGEVDAALIHMLQADNIRMRAAGLKLSEAALHVIREYDGTHRLSLAVAEWAKAVADEGGREDRFAASPTPPVSPTPDSMAPAGADDVGEFSWKVWTGSGRQISEVALIRSGACCGYVWRLAKGGWAFGLERKAAISEGCIFPDALNGLLAHVRAHAALTPSAPIAAPVRDDGAREALESKTLQLRGWRRRACEAEAALALLCPRSDADFRSVIAKAFHDFTCAQRQIAPWAVISRFRDFYEGCEAKYAYDFADKLLASLPTPASDVPGEAQTQAARDVLAERRRQVSAEGWTPEHDDAHTKGEIAHAAAAYIDHSVRFRDAHDLGVNYQTKAPNTLWPWNWHWWKPKNPRRDLVRAGALILAEIERLDRSSGEAQTQEGGR